MINDAQLMAPGWCPRDDANLGDDTWAMLSQCQGVEYGILGHKKCGNAKCNCADTEF